MAFFSIVHVSYSKKVTASATKEWSPKQTSCNTVVCIFSDKQQMQAETFLISTSHPHFLHKKNLFTKETGGLIPGPEGDDHEQSNDATSEMCDCSVNLVYCSSFLFSSCNLCHFLPPATSNPSLFLQSKMPLTRAGVKPSRGNPTSHRCLRSSPTSTF